MGDNLPEVCAMSGESVANDTLCNMSWWDTISYDALGNWVPTLGRVPKDVHHGLALLRGAVCKEIRLARISGDNVAEDRAWKLLTFLDRVILCAPLTTRGGKSHNTGLSKVITSRLRLAWKGDWGALWRESAAAWDRTPQGKGRAKTTAEEARSITQLLTEGLVSKALGLVLRKGAVVVEQEVYATLQSLFP